ncbi:hypothetical protein SPI_00165 [Niveomyces insectorum RCEF 264]|uniref:Aminoglycoside phosphotransferase n=1 Tax=Niveomyces insectorum RCEF 264 TaxID=1081102 RepID=A0A167ZW98_9HYPO|nr:hypothetical protein SPI_00165 [Niveomyces insectorum RCEF 264]
MPDTICLVDGTETNLEDALASEKNIVVRHRQWEEMMQLYIGAYEKREALERLVAFHIGVSAARVKTDHPSAWRRGGFNLAIPMLVFDGAGEAEVNRVMLRLPIPIKCGEVQHPGSVREKLRCETASYVWMQRHCPGVRIPHLYGFGFPHGAHFSFAGRLSMIRRAVLYVRQLVASWLYRPVPSSYLSVTAPDMPLETGYMVIEHFGEATFGKQLPLVAHGQRLLDQPAKMRNLFRGVSRIILDLARVPQPRIGAFCFNDDGTISLDGRPTSSDMAILESEGAPRAIPVDKTYTNTDQYVSDLSTLFEAQFLAAPNAALNTVDCEAQMSIMVFLRAVAHHFIEPNRRNGPFFLYMSDANAANFMVDDEWNVTGMFDLEWIFAAPADVFFTPTWLTWSSIDHISRPGYDEYSTTREAFMKIFKEEEQRMDTSELEAALGGSTFSAVMEASWSSGRAWFYQSLMTVDAMLHITEGRIQPLFVPDELPYSYFCKLWHQNSKDIVAQKLRDREEHKAAIARLFQDTG